MHEENRLLTLVQISDLHVGTVEDHGLDAVAKRSWQRFKFLDGFLGHDGNALIRTEKFVRSLREGEDARVVVTGDLTSMGRKAEFENASAFLSTGLRWKDTLAVGLDCPDWRERSIPGNHDRWPGTDSHLPMLGKPSPGFTKHFGAQLPVSDHTLSLKWSDDEPPVNLRLVGIDTEADVRPRSLTRFLARGSFRSQLKRLRQEGHLPPADENEIRVLLMHHSLLHADYVLGVARSSRSALEQFLGAEGFRLVLTGHTHAPKVDRPPLRYKGKELDVWEACCGTTTQRVDPPYDWDAGPRDARNASAKMNSLLVHRFYGTRQGVTWECKAYGLTRRGWRHCAIPPRTTPLSVTREIWSSSARARS